MEEKQKRFRRLKEWASRNSEQIGAVVGITGVVAIYGGVVALAYHLQKKQNAEWDATVSDALRTGKTIIPQKDGSFMILDKTKIAEVV